jgi:hypothetical protein
VSQGVEHVCTSVEGPTRRSSLQQRAKGVVQTSRGRRSSQDGFSQQQEAGPLFLPQLNRSIEAYAVQWVQKSKLDDLGDQVSGRYTRVPRRPMTGRLSKLLRSHKFESRKTTFLAQPR